MCIVPACTHRRACACVSMRAHVHVRGLYARVLAQPTTMFHFLRDGQINGANACTDARSPLIDKLPALSAHARKIMQTEDHANRALH